jgi:hypothetical protein
LANAELAYNEVDDVLYYGKGSGGAGGTASTIEAIAGKGAVVTLSSIQTIGGAKTFTGSVALGGSATADTQGLSDSSTAVATTAFVKGQGYLVGNQSITISGDADGTGTTAISLTLGLSGVTAGTYNNSATAVEPFTVDAKGRVTSIGAPVTITPAWGSVTGKPTTLSGYGITDALNSSQLGVANGIATLDGDGKVPASQLPSYVDDVVEYVNLAGFPATGESSKIYVAQDTNKTYRWTGSGYVEVGANTATADEALALATPRSITITGDASWSVSFDGSANVTSGLTLANSGVTAGTYGGTATQSRSITVDAKGRVTGVGALTTITPAWGSITSKPTTLAGYGITDAQAKDADLTAIAALAGTSGFLTKTAANTWALDTSDYLATTDTIDCGTF